MSFCKLSLILISIISVISISCGTSINTKYLSKNSIEVFKEKLRVLDNQKIESIPQASTLFINIFKSEKIEIRDSAFFEFVSWCDSVVYFANQRLMDDTLEYWRIYNVSEDSTEKIPDILIEKNRYFLNNGLCLLMDVGDTYLILDGDYLARNFYSFLSPTLVNYLKQDNIEYKLPMESDAAIILEPKEYAQRLTWWFNFEKDNPSFDKRWKSGRISKVYISILFGGMDNASIVDVYQKNDIIHIDSFFIETLRFLKEMHFYNTDLLNKLDKYYQYIIDDDWESANVIIRNLIQDGILENWAVENFKSYKEIYSKSNTH